jgi:dienelactone hydrolase
MKVLTYHAFCEDLASHGWVVAAIDSTYNARAVQFPDGRVLGNLPDSERGWPKAKDEDEEVRFYRERVAHMARDASFVIDQLEALNRGQGPFAGRLDLESGVGVLGHSRGGQAAGAARILDERVRGGINLDGFAGNSPIQPIEGEGITGDQPFLWILRAPEVPTDEQLARGGHTRAEFDERIRSIVSDIDKKLEVIPGGAIRRVVDRPGVTHVDFSDEPFWDGSMTDESRPGKVETIQETRVWLRAFLEATVRGEKAELKRLVESLPASTGPVPAVQVYGDLLP